MSQLGILLLKQLEGLKLEAYLDQAGVWSIGYGHTGSDVTPISKITLEEAEDLLDRDINQREVSVVQLVRRPISNNQFSALVIFVFNVGVTHFKLSTLLTLLNNYTDLNTVAKEFAKWNKVEDPKSGMLVVDHGLVNRRAQEAKLFLTPDGDFVPSLTQKVEQPQPESISQVVTTVPSTVS